MKISIWTGHAFEPWGPISADQGGIGGSETAAIHMAFELAALGHQVTMFGEHEGKEGIIADWVATTFGSVEWVDYRRAIKDPKIAACDVFVSSRDKSVLRLKPDAKVKVLWVHDIHVGDDWEGEVALFDRVYCLTKWHKDFVMEHYPHVEPEKFFVTRNGIDPARFHPEMPWEELRAKKGPRFVWSSSLDRGLDVMLDVWPEIRKLEPRAELGVYYGIENWRKLNAENKPGLATIDFMMERIRRLEGDGVRYHGRVGQRELAEAHMGAICWAYPTAWMETFAITALEAQAAGAYPVTSRLAALPETVFAGTLLGGRNKSAEYKKSFVDAVAAALRDEDGFASRTAEVSREFTLRARTWAGVAREWEADFEGLLGER
jgi:glycosyltransferase involved in cell wall biosynthesis